MDQVKLGLLSYVPCDTNKEQQILVHTNDAIKLSEMPGFSTLTTLTQSVVKRANAFIQEDWYIKQECNVEFP